MIIVEIVFSMVAIAVVVMGIRFVYLMYQFEKILKRSCPDDDDDDDDDDMENSEKWRQKEQEILKIDNYRRDHCSSNYESWQ